MSHPTNPTRERQLIDIASTALVEAVAARTSRPAGAELPAAVAALVAAVLAALTAPGAVPTSRPGLVVLDPERLHDCMRLDDALYRQTGIEIDPGAVRDALRTLAGAR